MRKLLHGLARPSTYLPVLIMAALGVGISMGFIPQNTIAIIINGLFVAVTVMIIAAYGPALVASLRAETARRDQYLVSGIIMLWLSIAASRVWSLALIMAGKPPWMINHWFQTFCYLTAAASGFYFLKITGPSKTGTRYTAAAVILAVLIVTFVLAFFEA